MSLNDRFLNDYAAGSAGADFAAQRNRVLRNTYWLLALSLVPTVLGAWLGMATGIGYAFTGWLRLVEAPGLRMAPQPARPHQKQEQIQGHRNAAPRSFH